MIRRILPLILALALCLPFTAYALDSGFVEVGAYTNTKNQYFFNTDEAIVVYSKEATLYNEYENELDAMDTLYSGTDLYVPIYCYPQSGTTEAIATDKQVKEDSVTVSGKVMRGVNNVGEITLVDGKKQKITGLPAGAYAKIPFVNNADNLNRASVSVRLVLSVNGVSYQDTRVTFTGFVANRYEDITDNSVYGAKIASQFKAAPRYNGEATFDFGDGVRYTARVRAGERYFLDLSKEDDASIAAMHPDAHLQFYNFRGDNDTFESKGRLEIPVDKNKFKGKGKDAKPAIYAYEIVDDALVALFADTISFESKTSKLVLSTRELGNYVLSSMPLKPIVTGQDENILMAGYDLSDYVSEEDTPEEQDSAPEQTSSATEEPADSYEPGPQTGGEDGVSNLNDAPEDMYPAAEQEQSASSLSAKTAPANTPIRATNPAADNPQTNGGFPAPAVMLCFGGIAAIALNRRKVEG